MKKAVPAATIEELQARCDRLERLTAVSRVLHSTLDPKQALQLIVREAVRLVSARSGSVILINPTNGFLEIEAAHGLPPKASTLKLRVGEGITGWVALTGKPARVGRVQEDPRYIQLRGNVVSELAVPLLVNGHLRGVVNVDADRPDAFDESDESLLQELALEAARVIQNTWLYEQLRQKARLFESLFNVAQTINTAINVDEALQVIVSESCILMNAKVSSLLMLDPTREWLDLRASHGAGKAYIEKPRLRLDDSLVGIVVRRKKPLQVENVQISSRYQNVEVARVEGLVSLLSVPLVFGGRAIGALNVYKDRPYNFSNEEMRILTALAEFSAIALEKARLYERIVDAEDQLRQNEKLSALGLLAAEVAHEIRNPLTVIKMLFHSLDLQFGTNDPRSQDVQIIGSKMEQLNKIVEQILGFARHAEPRLAPVSINMILDNLALLVRHKLLHQRIELIRSTTENLPLVNADASQLEQAFLNLILNAVEAMPDGGTLQIRSAIDTEENLPGAQATVLIEFKDSGVGMTAEQRERAFTSLLSTSKATGTGLGLAIVARVVEAHDGTVDLRSRPHRGATFRIRLPAYFPKNPGPASGSEPAPEAANI